VSVALVGAGPGDKGLLTLRGAELLQAADVVLYDRIVGADILAMIPGNAEKIDVGKHAGNHPVPQEEINRLLFEKARQGLKVVRLKGGDPFVFGRGGEELELLAAHNIPFEMAPGVSSAIAGPAYAGIPVTHRDCASSVHIITAHAHDDEPPNINYNALVSTGGTLVFMMGVAAIDAICKGCIAAGMDADMPAAIIENAATNTQRAFLGTALTLPAIARANNVQSPAVVIIGKVCGFSERYDWFSKRPLHGKRVIVARGRDRTSNLSDRLRELGCQVTEIPCLKIVPLTGHGCMLEKKLAGLQAYTWLVFTSGVGVTVFFDYIIENKFDIRSLHHLKIACVGIGTGREVNKHGIKVDYYPAEYNGVALARGLATLLKNHHGEKLLIFRAKDADADLTRVLADAGIAFDDVPVYDKIKNKDEVNEIVNKISENNIIAFTSSSAVETVIEAAAHIDFSKIKAVCIGEKTASAAKSRGMEVHIAAEATIESMAAKIGEIL